MPTDNLLELSIQTVSNFTGLLTPFADVAKAPPRPAFDYMNTPLLFRLYCFSLL
jgi:hypothetical protein